MEHSVGDYRSSSFARTGCEEGGRWKSPGEALPAVLTRFPESAHAYALHRFRESLRAPISGIIPLCESIRFLCPYISATRNRRVMRKTFSILLLMASISSAQQFEGQIRGTVVDAKTKEPLPGVNVIVLEREGMGTATSDDGTFFISSLPVGT